MEFIKYEHHGEEVWVREDLKGKHREYCLCYSCKKLNLEDQSKNCSIANLLYAVDIAMNITTPVWECPLFETKEE